MVSLNDGEYAQIVALQNEVTALAVELAARHATRLHCAKGCSGCCVDGLTVFEVEAGRIARDFAEILAEEDPHPVGRCAFLDKLGSCRIYTARPYVCRTQGLPLRWLDENPDDADQARLEDDWAEDEEAIWVEYRDICPLNLDGDPPLEELAEDDCWTIGPVETRLAELQSCRDGGVGKRLELRSLFAKTQVFKV